MRPRQSEHLLQGIGRQSGSRFFSFHSLNSALRTVASEEAKRLREACRRFIALSWRAFPGGLGVLFRGLWPAKHRRPEHAHVLRGVVSRFRGASIRKACDARLNPCFHRQLTAGERQRKGVLPIVEVSAELKSVPRAPSVDLCQVRALSPHGRRGRITPSSSPPTLRVPSRGPRWLRTACARQHRV